MCSYMNAYILNNTATKHLTFDTGTIDFSGKVCHNIVLFFFKLIESNSICKPLLACHIFLSMM